MKKQLEESISERRILEEGNTKKDIKLNELSTRLKHSDDNAKKHVDQVSFRAVFKWLSKNQNQSNYSDQSQQEQTARRTNHNS